MQTSGTEIQIRTAEALRHVMSGHAACGDWTDQQKTDFQRQLAAEMMRRQELATPLKLKSVSELIGDMPFLVEQYQRGYKWKSVQVLNLLDDIDAFVPEVHGSFYCLQPLVVSYRSDGHCWELIDGQQRLTTIYLILSWLGLPAFPLHYKTRKSCTAFLAALPTRHIDPECSWKEFVAKHGREVDNVDNFHFFQAWQTIAQWFGRHPEKRLSWPGKLLHQTRVIWYNALASDKEQAPQIFMRINSGKIALTNAELVRALFLKQASAAADGLRQTELAQDWDRYEQALHDDAFWYFLTGSRAVSIPNRIELLFDIQARRPARGSDDPFHTFNYFDRQHDLAHEWAQIKKLFLRFRDWYEDSSTYHRIGFLVASGIKKVDELAREGDAEGKTAFVARLDRHIRDAFGRVKLEELRYGSNNRTIQQLLLLFNVMKSDAAIQYGNRFPFDRYLSEHWSLEHIHARHSVKLDDEAAASAFHASLLPLMEQLQHELPGAGPAREQFERLKASHAASHAETNRRSDTAKALLVQLRLDSYHCFGDGLDEEEMDSIDNLALLDRDANSKLNNAIFPEKRKMIQALDQQGRFIPAGTRDVFMKYYNDKVTQMSIWSKPDRIAYLQQLLTTLAPYLPATEQP